MQSRVIITSGFLAAGIALALLGLSPIPVALLAHREGSDEGMSGYVIAGVCFTALSLLPISRGLLIVTPTHLRRLLVPALERSQVSAVRPQFVIGRGSTWLLVAVAPNRPAHGGMVALATFRRSSADRKGRRLAEQLGVPYVTQAPWVPGSIASEDQPRGE